MEKNPFRPVKQESYEQQLDLSAPPTNLLDETDDLVDVGLSSHAGTEDAKPKFLESSTEGLTSGALGPKVTGGASSSSATSRSASVGQTEQGASSNPSGLFARLCGWFSLEYYQPYFEVTSSVVLNRMKEAVSPHKKDIFGNTPEAQPDLYGAVWISLTLVFLIGATSNLNSYLKQDATKVEPWEQDYTLLTGASSMVFMYVFLIPVVIWAASFYFGVDPRPSLAKLIGLYGYMIVVFIPVSILCVIPIGALQWIVVILAGGLSSIVLMRNLHTAFGTSYNALSQGDTEAQSVEGVRASPARASFLLISAAVAAHGLFSLLLKLLFFQGAEINITPNSDTGKGTNKTI